MPDNIHNVLNDWQEWGLTEKPELIKTFNSGQNHHTGLIQTANRHYVLKVFTHSFEQAITAQQWAATIDIAPKVYYADQPIVLMEYVDDQTPTLQQVASSLKQLHQQQPPTTQQLDLMAFCDQYLDTANDTVKQQHQKLLPLLKEFMNDSTPWCYCHNDLVVENYLQHNNQAILIDWEYAAVHNPWFDLAAIVLYQDLDKDKARLFLDHYNQWGDKINDRIFVSAQLALLWGDLLWHVAQYGNDYKQQNSERFRKVDNFAELLA